MRTRHITRHMQSGTDEPSRWRSCPLQLSANLARIAVSVSFDGHLWEESAMKKIPATDLATCRKPAKKRPGTCSAKSVAGISASEPMLSSDFAFSEKSP